MSSAFSFLCRTLPAVAITTGLITLTSLATVSPAMADTPPSNLSIWGYSGLVLMPTGVVHGFRDYSAGSSLVSKAGDVQGLTPFVTAGLFEGLEAGVLYGVPLNGFTGLSGHAKYQLVKPTRERPTAVAVGLSLIGVGGPERYVEGNSLYLVLSQDFNLTYAGQTYTWLVGHFGFSGNLSFGARMMAGAELPLGNQASLFGDFMGPLGRNSGFFNIGAAWRPIRDWQLRLYSMGTPDGDWLDRDYAVAVSYSGNILGNGSRSVQGLPQQHTAAAPKPVPVAPTPYKPRIHAPSPLPSTIPSKNNVRTTVFPVAPSEPPSPAPSPAPSPPPSAPVLPSPSADPFLNPDAPAPLSGTLVDDKNRPLTGWSVGVAAQNRWATTDAEGRYRLVFPLGPLELLVRDPEGKTHLTKSVRLVTPRGLELPMVVTLPTGDCKGTIVDAQNKQGIADATVRLFRVGNSFMQESRANGSFHFSDLPAGDYRYVITRHRFKPLEGTVVISAKRETTLQAALQAKPGSLVGRVTSGQGKPLAGVSVALPALKLETLTDGSGEYQFQDVPPGQHQIIFNQGSQRLATTVVKVQSDETSTENVTTKPQESLAEKGGTLFGKIVDQATRRPLSGAKVVVEAKELTVLTISGPDGTFRITDLPSGRYRVSVSRPGYQTSGAQTTVNGKSGARVSISLAPRR
ncbi:MAG: carboxypeptidase regulatory-like domain-containing protein [Candidatus Sericytochromatia bacterium]|nr:carboxypeptidase regulatory-like domain-containing protein [Candidatus Sericytochromatia bacterium]